MNGKFMFGGQIPPFLMPLMQGNDDGQRGPADDDAFVPPRINKAMEFLELIALKRRRQAATTDHTMEVIEPDDLVPEEEAARDAALQCLAKYFDGKLEQNVWEDLRLQSLKDKTESEKENVATSLIQMTRVCPCPSCLGENKECEMCDGCGQLVFEPANNLPENVSISPGTPSELANHPLVSILEQLFANVAQNGNKDEDDNK